MRMYIRNLQILALLRNKKGLKYEEIRTKINFKSTT